MGAIVPCIEVSVWAAKALTINLEKSFFPKIAEKFALEC